MGNLNDSGTGNNSHRTSQQNLAINAAAIIGVSSSRVLPSACESPVKVQRPKQTDINDRKQAMDMELQNFLRNEPKGIKKGPRDPEIKVNDGIEKRPREPEIKVNDGIDRRPREQEIKVTENKTEKRRRPPLEH